MTRLTVPTLLRLAAPNVLVMMLLAAVTILDAVYVGWLGSEALAGVSLARLLVAAVGGWLAIHQRGSGLAGLFIAMAVALVAFGLTVAVAIRAGAWR